MIETFLTGIGLLVIMAVWKMVWVPTVLDATRDTIFDLRDNVLRDYFVKNQISFDDPMYLRLRTLLNGHLRHTESLTFWEFGAFKALIECNEELNKKRIADINLKFKSNDAKLQELIDKIRYESSVAMISYMIETSVITMGFALFYIPYLMLKHLPVKAFFSTKMVINARTLMERYALTGA